MSRYTDPKTDFGFKTIARSMVARGLDIKLIAELTEVDEDELRDLLL